MRKARPESNGEESDLGQKLLLPALASLLAVFSMAGGLSYLSQEPVTVPAQGENSDAGQVPQVGSEPLLLPQANYIMRPTEPATKLLPPLLDAEAIRRAAEQRSPTLLPDPPAPRPAIPDYSEEDPPEPEEGANASPTPQLSDFWFVGDSIVVGFHETLGAADKQLYGRIGAGSEAIVNEAIPLLPQVVGKYRFAVVALGTNDSLGGEENFRRNVGRLVEANSKVGLCTIWLSIHRNNEGQDWNSYNDVLRSIADETTGLRIVDWDSLAKNTPEYLYSDGIHIKPTGYETLWKMVLDEAGLCPAVKS